MQYQEALRFLNLEYPITQDDVKSAYRRLARIYHPDAGGSDELFKRLTQAYKVALQGPEHEHKETYREETYTNNNNTGYNSYSYFQLDAYYIIVGLFLLAVLAFFIALYFRYDYYLAFARFWQTAQPYIFIILAGVVCMFLPIRRIGAGVVICLLLLLVGCFVYQETLPLISQHIQNIDNIVSAINF